MGFEGMDLQIESESFDPDGYFLSWKPGSAPVPEPTIWPGVPIPERTLF
jgi:hypothetical protein